MKSLAAGLVLLALAQQTAPAEADTVSLEHRRQIETCLADTEGRSARRACVGLVAGPCVNSDAGVTTAGAVQCYGAERGVWEHLLEEYADQLRSRESVVQRQHLARALQTGQDWALARCAYDASVFEGGSLAIVVAASCMTETTAHRAIDLRNRIDQYEDF